jgi:hypothetical protein
MDSASTQDLEILEISWNGERLPMELWFKVFQYYCISSPQPEDALAAVEILNTHPIIVEILNRFLPYLTGYTFSNMRRASELAKEQQDFDITSGHNLTILHDKHGTLAFTFVPADLTIPRSGANSPFYGFQASKWYHGSIFIYQNSVTIHNPRHDGFTLQEFNTVLPFGCFILPLGGGRFGVYVPYPPGQRDSEGKDYKLVCEMESSGSVTLDYDKDFLYIPPWRPQ